MDLLCFWPWSMLSRLVLIGRALGLLGAEKAATSVRLLVANVGDSRAVLCRGAKEPAPLQACRLSEVAPIARGGERGGGGNPLGTLRIFSPGLGPSFQPCMLSIMPLSARTKFPFLASFFLQKINLGSGAERLKTRQLVFWCERTTSPTAPMRSSASKPWAELSICTASGESSAHRRSSLEVHLGSYYLGS